MVGVIVTCEFIRTSDCSLLLCAHVHTAQPWSDEFLHSQPAQTGAATICLSSPSRFGSVQFSCPAKTLRIATTIVPCFLPVP